MSRRSGDHGFRTGKERDRSRSRSPRRESRSGRHHHRHAERHHRHHRRSAAAATDATTTTTTATTTATTTTTNAAAVLVVDEQRQHAPSSPYAVEAREERRQQDNVALCAKSRLKAVGIQMRLSSRQPAESTRPKISVAAAFNQDSDEEPEQLPPEARMRMRNVGRDTPTSSGPNSFGKTKHGFSDAKKVFERNLREAMENALKDD